MNLRQFRPIATLALALVAIGCLEPEKTPLGPDVLGGPLPDDAVVLRIAGADSLGLIPFTWNEPAPDFEPDMLFCGYDSLTGFRAEPLWTFDTAPLAEAAGSLSDAFLRLYLPESSPEIPQDGDNPDLGRDVRVRLRRVVGELALEQFLQAPLIENLPGDVTTELVPMLDDEGELTTEPFTLEFATGEGYRIDPATVERWVASEEQVTLALEWMDPAETEGAETGMIRLYSRLSTALEGDSLTAAVLKVRFGASEGLSTASVAEGQALSREEPTSPETLLLTTGIERRAHFALDLPESLHDPKLMVIRARLLLYPADSLLFGMSPDDLSDNFLSGLPAFENALTLTAIASDDDTPGSSGLSEGGEITDDLPIFEEHLVYSDPDDNSTALLSRSRLAMPLELPLTQWVQGWANGTEVNKGLTLFLNGQSERARQAAWHIDPMDPALRPTLELIYVWRPDFD